MPDATLAASYQAYNDANRRSDKAFTPHQAEICQHSGDLKFNAQPEPLFVTFLFILASSLPSLSP